MRKRKRFEAGTHSGYPAIFDREKVRVAGFERVATRDEALDMMREEPTLSDLWAWTDMPGGKR